MEHLLLGIVFIVIGLLCCLFFKGEMPDKLESTVIDMTETTPGFFEVIK